MTTTQNTAPVFYPGQYAGVAPFYLPYLSPDSTENLAFTPKANSEQNVNGIQPLDQTGIMTAEVVDVDFSNLSATAAYTAVTATADLAIVPAQLFASVKLSLQKSSTLVSCSGLGLTIVNYFHPHKQTAPQGTRLGAVLGTANPGSVSGAVYGQPGRALPEVAATNKPTVSASGTAGSATVNLSLDTTAGTMLNHMSFVVPASITFDEYYSYNVADGSLDTVMPNEIVSPQYMATNRNVTLALKTNPLFNLSEPWAGLAVATSNTFASGDLSFSDISSSSGSLTVYREGAYLPTGGNLALDAQNPAAGPVAVPAEAASPLIHMWQRDISEDSVTIGSGASYTYPLPQDGQVGLIAFWIQDPGNPDIAPSLQLNSRTLDIDNWLKSVTFQQSGGQVLYQLTPAMARQMLIEQTGLYLPGVLAFDFWNVQGMITNRQNPNTLLTSAVQVKLEFVAGALSSSAQLIAVTDGLQTVQMTSGA